MDGRHMTHRSEIPPTNQPAPKKAAPKIANLNKNVAQRTIFYIGDITHPYILKIVSFLLQQNFYFQFFSNNSI